MTIFIRYCCSTRPLFQKAKKAFQSLSVLCVNYSLDVVIMFLLLDSAYLPLATPHKYFNVLKIAICFLDNCNIYAISKQSKENARSKKPAFLVLSNLHSGMHLFNN